MSTAVEHEAGPMVEGVQRCRWCPHVFLDTRNMAVGPGSFAPRAWREGQKLVVVGKFPVETWPRSAWEKDTTPCLKQ